MDRFFECPECGRKVRLDAERYMNMAVHIRCQKCSNTWWVEIHPVTEPAEAETISDPDYQEARRLARFIIQEVKLYHQKEIEEATTREEVLKALEKDLDLARKHYLSRVPAHVRDRERLFDKAIEEYLLVGKK